MSPSSSLSNEFAEKRAKQPGNEEEGERSRKETRRTPERTRKKTFIGFVLREGSNFSELEHNIHVMF